MAMKYRADIDGLRTLAVLPVVLFHANVSGFSGGFIGVDVFFVISGFLITSIINDEMVDNRFSIVNFYERRARRILPALFGMVVACFVAGWLLLVPEDYEHMGRSVLSTLFFFSNIWFWQNTGGYFQGASEYLPALHTWSLAVEEQFYIVFPVLLVILHQMGRRLVFPLVFIVVVTSFLLAVWTTARMPSASFYLLPTRFWELGLGALLALGGRPIRCSKAVLEALAVLGLVAIVVPVITYDRSVTFPGLAALPPVLGAGLIIWVGNAGDSLVSRLLSFRPIVYVGLLSYSLYLWHWPIMAFARNWMLEVEMPPLVQMGTVCGSFLMAWVSCRFVERPFRKPISAGGWSRQKVFGGACVGVTGLTLLSAMIIISNGAAGQRFDQQNLNSITSIERYEPGKECFNTYDPSKLCSFGSSEVAPSWLLWGDSHARHLLPALSDIAERAGRSFLFAGAANCPPLIGIQQVDSTDRAFGQCEAFREEVIRRIETMSSLDTVILAARWPVYVEGVRLPDENKGAMLLYRRGDSFDVKDASRNATLVEKGLNDVRERISTSGKRMIVIGTVPEIPWSVAAKFKAHALFGRPLPAAPMLSEVEHRQSQTNAILKRVTSHSGSSLISLVDKICTPECPTHSEEAVFYHDNSHLTPSGARFLIAGILEQILLPAPARTVERE